jgi:cytochrome d ubiquinol oxidase subunit II
VIVDLWFWLVAATFAAYVVLDGYDLGAGIVSLFVAKTNAERRVVLHTILPYWDGNEVFLVAGGATLYLAFPRLFPAFVSGFYLPVMIVLWLLMLRGLGIEMRHKLDHPLWNQLWDGGFFVSSLLLVLFFGAALGNIVRGVSVDDHGEFFAPLWTNFRVGDEVGILDWYTLLVAVTAILMIARHGALRLVVRAHPPAGDREGQTAAEDRVQERSAIVARRLAFPTLALIALTTVLSFALQPNLGASLAARPWTAIFAIVAAAGLWLAMRPPASDPAAQARRALRAFHGSSAALAGLFGCACAGIHPYGLLARIPSRSVLASDAAASPYALGVGLAWWVPGMLVVVGYSFFVQRRLLDRPAAKSDDGAGTHAPE